jgi:hypothetical protein
MLELMKFKNKNKSFNELKFSKQFLEVLYINFNEIASLINSGIENIY